ncbi:HIT family protein [Flavobacteriaceae bacterium]|nr:HIT family protein [Flavobacteriaceae bacterium]
MATVFTKIIQGEIPSYKVAEDDKHFAFLDINPNSPGHTLVVPKQEVDRIFDLSETDYIDLMAFSRKLGKAIEAVIPCQRVGISVIGLEVPHCHVHLIPLADMSSANFQNKVKLSPEEFERIALKISEAIS